MDTVAYVNVYDELIESIVKTVTLVPWQVSIGVSKGGDVSFAPT